MNKQKNMDQNFQNWKNSIKYRIFISGKIFGFQFLNEFLIICFCKLIISNNNNNKTKVPEEIFQFESSKFNKFKDFLIFFLT